LTRELETSLPIAQVDQRLAGDLHLSLGPSKWPSRRPGLRAFTLAPAALPNRRSTWELTPCDSPKNPPSHELSLTSRRLQRPVTLDRLLPRKEVIQPQLPLRLPCYDFVPITSPTFDACLEGCPPLARTASGLAGFHDVTGGVYKARERIHRGVLTHGY
jgi:hypothetical protein